MSTNEPLKPTPSQATGFEKHDDVGREIAYEQSQHVQGTVPLQLSEPELSPELRPARQRRDTGVPEIHVEVHRSSESDASSESESEDTTVDEESSGKV